MEYFGIEGDGPGLQVAEGGQAHTSGVAIGHDRIEGGPVLADQLMEESAPASHLVEAFGIVLPCLHHGSQLAGQVAQLRHGGAHPLVEGVERRTPRQSPRCLGQPVDSADLDDASVRAL